MQKDIYKTSRIMYIIEAGLEYLVSIMVAGSFLATVTKEIGISDSLTGIISSFISLGCLFELVSLFIRGRRMKPFVVVFSIINQLLFMLLYVIPVVDMGGKLKTVIFVAAIFLAYFVYYVAHPKKINWFMSLIDNNVRGRFTANKEIISLIMGMVFTFVMGTVIDRFEAVGKIKTAFIFSAIVIFVLTVSHTLTMVFSKEKAQETTDGKDSLFKEKLAVLRDPNVLKIAFVFIMWNMAAYSTTPFYGTYQIKELGFSLTFVSVLQIMGSAVRVLFSRVMGAYADKRSFIMLTRLCLLVMSGAFLCNVFCVPANGRVFFALYTTVHAIGAAGINNALTNIVFDYVSVEKRADSFAISQAFAGAAGFVATLCISPLVAHIQNNSNTLFGIPVYAQQVTSLIACVFAAIGALYVHFAMIKRG